MLLGSVLLGMAAVFGALASLGALSILAVCVHQWTRSIALAVLATVASLCLSVFGFFWLMIWAVSEATFG